MRNAAAPLVVGLLLLAVWQMLHWGAGADLVSAPAETAAYLIQLMGTARFWGDVGETGLAFLWALLLSALFGIALGVALGFNSVAGDVIEPILVSFYALPKVTLYPIVLLGFGLGLSAKVAFGVMHALVPITLFTRNAIVQIKPVYWRSARVLGLTPLATVRRIVLPAILPDLVAALRVGFSLSLLGVLIGEMFASKRGLGFVAMNAMGLGDIKAILAIGVFVSACAILGTTLLLVLERTVRRQ